MSEARPVARSNGLKAASGIAAAPPTAIGHRFLNGVAGGQGSGPSWQVVAVKSALLKTRGGSGGK